MSRPQNLHKPIKGQFNNILAAVALGQGKAKKAAKKQMANEVVRASQPKNKKS